MQQQSGTELFLQQHNSNYPLSLTSNNKAFIRPGLLCLISSCFVSTQNKCLICTLLMKNRFIVSASPCMLDEIIPGQDDINRSHLTATKRCLSSSASHPFLTFNICVICTFPGSSINTAVKHPCSPGVPGTSKHKDTGKTPAFGLLIHPAPKQAASIALQQQNFISFQNFCSYFAITLTTHISIVCFSFCYNALPGALVTLLFVQTTD